MLAPARIFGLVSQSTIGRRAAGVTKRKPPYCLISLLKMNHYNFLDVHPTELERWKLALHCAMLPSLFKRYAKQYPSRDSSLPLAFLLFESQRKNLAKNFGFSAELFLLS